MTKHKCSELALLLVFSGLKCHISVTQSPKCTRLKRITNQFSFMYNFVNSYIYCCRACFLLVANHNYSVVHQNYASILIFFIFLISISFPFVLDYLLIEWSSLTQSSCDGPRDSRCSLMTYQGQLQKIIMPIKF